MPALKTTTSVKPGDIDGGRQHEFLIASAEPVALACVTVVSPPVMMQAGGRTGRPVRDDLPRDGGVHARDLARLAFDRAGEHQRAEAEFARARARRHRAPGDCCRPPCCARARKSGSPGFGVSGISPRTPLLDALAHGGGHALAQISYFSRIATAPAKVEASGAVGPEPMTSRSSPITSESSSASTAAGAARRASCPPLMREMCLRTALISWMLAPQASSRRVVACFSSSVMGVAGSGSSADAPPEIRQSTRSSGAACGGDFGDARARRRRRARRAPDGRTRCSSMRRSLAGVAVLDVDQTGGDAAAQDALGGCAMEAPALPAPTT